MSGYNWNSCINPCEADVDPNAIHVNVANEINGIAELFAPLGTDIVAGEDSSASWVKKKFELRDIITVGMQPSTAIANNPNGYGGTNTRIVRWTTVQANSGSGGGLTWVQDADDGDYVSISTEGIYAITANIDRTAGAGADALWAINAQNSLVNDFSISGNRAMTTSDPSLPANLSWTGYLSAGWKIWLSVEDSNPLTASTARNRFSVSKFGKYQYGA